MLKIADKPDTLEPVPSTQNKDPAEQKNKQINKNIKKKG